MAKTYKRPFKNIVRKATFAELSPRASVLTLPSREVLCVKEMVEQGIINNHSKMQWIDENMATVRGWDSVPDTFKDFNHGNLYMQHARLETYEPVFPIDLFNADLEGRITPDLGLAFERNIAPALLPNATIILTMTMATRGNQEFEGWFKDQCSGDGILGSLVRQLAAKTHNFNPLILQPLAMLLCSLNRFDMDYFASFEYRDSTDMVAIRLDNIRGRRAAPVWPSFSSLVEQFEAQREAKARDRDPSLRPLADRLAEALSLHDMAFQENDKGTFDLMALRATKSIIIRCYDSLEDLAEHWLGVNKKEGAPA